MQMYLNKDKTQSVEFSSYSRELDVPNPDIRFNLNLNFSGDYAADGIEYLADFANNNITDIEIVNENNTVVLTSAGSIGKLVSLNETCDGYGKSGYATIQIYEVGAII